MRTKFSGILTLLLALVVQLSFAQTKTITGTVTDDQGLPLPGANVIIKGTNTGTQTDFDGEYSISAAVGEVLTFSYVGFETQEVTVGVQPAINIALQPGSVLEEVVITGYGNSKQDVLTSAVSLVTAEELEELVSTTSVDNLLQGKAAGVQVTSANGKPGSTAFVRIRGTSSLVAGASSPLYIVDGAPIDEQDLNAIPNNEIESISILKDAATTSQYGSRGANGVVVITTKKGKKNRDATIRFSSRYGVANRANTDIDIMTAEEKLRYEAELAALVNPETGNPGVPAAQSLPGATATPAERAFLIANAVDWEEIVLREAIIQSNNISFSGGEEKVDYFFSLGHDRNTGIIDGVSGFERLNGRLNVNFNAKSWLDVGASIAYSRSKSDEPRDRNNVQNPFRAIFDYNAYEPEFILDDQGNVVFDDNGDPLYNFNHTGFLITEAIATTPEDEIQNLTFFNSYANVIFSDSWNYRLQFSLNHENFRREYYVQPGNRLDFFVGDPDFPGIKTDNGFQEVDYTISNTLNYTLNNEVHNFNAYGLFEYNFNEENRYRLSSSGFPSAQLTTQTNAARIDAGTTNRNRLTLVSYGLFANYDFKEKYLLGASVRYDGSSNFGNDNQYGLFYSASAGWNVAKEDFFAVDWVDDLKIRGSYGTVGNRGALGRYASQGTVGFGTYPGGSSTIPVNIANPDLQWEETAILDIGLELGLFNNRVSAVVDYFKKETDKLLFNVPAPDESGIPGFSIASNLGKIENSGVEVELSADIIRTEDLKWSLGGNVVFLDNKIVELPDNDGDGVGDDIEPNTFSTIFREGEEINAYFLLRYDGVDPATGRPLYLDADGNSVFFDDLPEGENRVLLDKSPNADIEGGFFTTVNYKGFGLRTDFVYRFGNYINNFVRSNVLSDGLAVDDNQDVGAFNYWQQPGDTNVLPSPIYGANAQQASDRFLEKGDFVRLRNVTLSYTFPRRYLDRTPFNSIRIYAQGQNLLTFTDFFGDPEVGISSGETISQAATVAPGEATLYSYPTLKSVTFGIDVSL
ncbi:MAG: TonB-dependent receptor [Flavobacteriales bacterium]|uniref:SusC/RagA family TonB-linked outer membrane protein n=1 Tax=Candidatus Ulvibacter alkanivorans TaxID=2267620 RepID=UPI000DF1EF08|nr:TonB-dependent receptor [Candidatus Ulvibacter alkanivorans]MCH2490609.1 TonB-dependent receptor [Flavobacteriales bacterium]